MADDGGDSKGEGTVKGVQNWGHVEGNLVNYGNVGGGHVKSGERDSQKPIKESAIFEGKDNSKNVGNIFATEAGNL